MLDPVRESDRLEIAKQLYARYRADAAERGENIAHSRLVAGIQIALRDAIDCSKTHPPYPIMEQN